MSWDRRPKISVRLAESAVSDLKGFKTRYTKQGVPGVGDRLVSEIVTRIEALCDHPEMGRIVPEFGQPLLREIVHPPFRIVYRRRPESVWIVRIWRSERLLVLPDDETI